MYKKIRIERASFSCKRSTVVAYRFLSASLSKIVTLLNIEQKHTNRHHPKTRLPRNHSLHPTSMPLRLFTYVFGREVQVKHDWSCPFSECSLGRWCMAQPDAHKPEPGRLLAHSGQCPLRCPWHALAKLAKPKQAEASAATAQTMARTGRPP